MGKKYELETIPVWDAFDQQSECPLCILDERAEKHYVEFFLGNSVMIPEMRVEVNDTGFCRYHFSELWKAVQNRLSLGLMTHTHFRNLIEDLVSWQKKAAITTREGAGRKRQIRNYLEHMKEREDSCMICSRIDYTLKRYTFTIVYLWQEKEDFRAAFNASKGFCLHHLPVLIDMACERLGARKLSVFMSELMKVQEENMNRVERELLWYTQKFDFQNSEKPWGTSKDALRRALQKITGRIFRES